MGVGVYDCRRVRLVDMSFSCPVGGCEFRSVFVVGLYLACIGRRIPSKAVWFCVCVCVCVCVFGHQRSCGDHHTHFHLSRGDTCNCGDKIFDPIITVSKNA